MDFASDLAERLPEPLLPVGYRQLLGAAAARLPRTEGGMAVECHLTAEERRADLVVRVFPRDRDRYLQQADAGEAHVRHFFQRWRDDPGLSHVPYADLECDVDGGAHPPFIGPMIDPYLPHGERALQAARDLGALANPPASSHQVAERVVRAFLAPAPSRGVLERMGACYAALPRGGFICHLTSLTTRASKPEDAVRLIVSLPRGELARYLTRLGWPSDLKALDEWLQLHRAENRRVDLDLDVDCDGPRAKVSVYSTSWPRTAGARALPHELASLGVASTRVAAIAAWLEERPSSGLPPRSLTIKRTFSDNVSAGIKAYLSWLHPVDPHAGGAQARRFA